MASQETIQRMTDRIVERFQTVEVLFVQETTEIVIVTVKAYYSDEESV